MPVFWETLHLGVTQEIRSETDPAMRIAQAVYPELFSPIETGIYQYDNELVLCLSSQVGCAMGCTFCSSTGPFNFPFEEHPRRFQRNLDQSEIVIQAYNARDVAIRNGFQAEPLLFSFMGMGEPLSNYPAVKLAINVLGQIFPNSRATISTIGHNTNAIRVLADDIINKEFPIPVKLHFSLHAPNDKLRRKLMPAASSIQDTLSAAKYFMDKTGLVVKANYLLMRGVNDRPQHEEELVTLLAGTGITLKVSDYNSPDFAQVVPSEAADAFADRIALKGIKTCRFKSLGQDASARCGELTIYQTERFKQIEQKSLINSTLPAPKS